MTEGETGALPPMSRSEEVRDLLERMRLLKPRQDGTRGTDSVETQPEATTPESDGQKLGPNARIIDRYGQKFFRSFVDARTYGKGDLPKGDELPYKRELRDLMKDATSVKYVEYIDDEGKAEWRYVVYGRRDENGRLIDDPEAFRVMKREDDKWVEDPGRTRVQPEDLTPPEPQAQTQPEAAPFTPAGKEVKLRQGHASENMDGMFGDVYVDLLQEKVRRMSEKYGAVSRFTEDESYQKTAKKIEEEIKRYKKAESGEGKNNVLLAYLRSLNEWNNSIKVIENELKPVMVDSFTFKKKDPGAGEKVFINYIDPNGKIHVATIDDQDYLKELEEEVFEYDSVEEARKSFDEDRKRTEQLAAEPGSDTEVGFRFEIGDDFKVRLLPAEEEQKTQDVTLPLSQPEAEEPAQAEKVVDSSAKVVKKIKMAQETDTSTKPLEATVRLQEEVELIDPELLFPEKFWEGIDRDEMSNRSIKGELTLNEVVEQLELSLERYKLAVNRNDGEMGLNELNDAADMLTIIVKSSGFEIPDEYNKDIENYLNGIDSVREQKKKLDTRSLSKRRGISPKKNRETSQKLDEDLNRLLKNYLSTGRELMQKTYPSADVLQTDVLTEATKIEPETPAEGEKPETTLESTLDSEKPLSEYTIDELKKSTREAMKKVEEMNKKFDELSKDEPADNKDYTAQIEAEYRQSMDSYLELLAEQNRRLEETYKPVMKFSMNKDRENKADFDAARQVITEAKTVQEKYKAMISYENALNEQKRIIKEIRLDLKPEMEESFVYEQKDKEGGVIYKIAFTTPDGQYRLARVDEEGLLIYEDKLSPDDSEKAKKQLDNQKQRIEKKAEEADSEYKLGFRFEIGDDFKVKIISEGEVESGEIAADDVGQVTTEQQDNPLEGTASAVAPEDKVKEHDNGVEKKGGLGDNIFGMERRTPADTKLDIRDKVEQFGSLGRGGKIITPEKAQIYGLGWEAFVATREESLTNDQKKEESVKRLNDIFTKVNTIAQQKYGATEGSSTFENILKAAENEGYSEVLTEQERQALSDAAEKISQDTGKEIDGNQILRDMIGEWQSRSDIVRIRNAQE
jgi:hypothetical protein